MCGQDTGDDISAGGRTLPTEHHTGTFVKLCDWFMGSEREKGDPGTCSMSRWVMQGHHHGRHVLGGEEEEEGVVFTHTCFACLVLSQARVKPLDGKEACSSKQDRTLDCVG